MSLTRMQGLSKCREFFSFRWVARLCVVAAVTLQTTNSLRAQTTHLYEEGKPVVLNGYIALTHGYGPPGYGEDPKRDLRITYWVLDLPHQINLPCQPERPEWKRVDCQPTRRMRLFVEGNKELLNEARSANEKRAEVSGSLHRKDTAGEMTPVYMEVKGIRVLP